MKPTMKPCGDVTVAVTMPSPTSVAAVCTDAERDRAGHRGIDVVDTPVRQGTVGWLAGQHPSIPADF
jgi:hypothetical protein